MSAFVTRKEREREREKAREKENAQLFAFEWCSCSRKDALTQREREKEKREIQNGIELYLIRAVPNLLHELGQTSHAAEEPAVTATTTAGE